MMNSTATNIGLEKKVKKYYDKNTPIFIKVGRTKESKNIHRLVWADGVKTDAEAMNYVNKLILDEIGTIPFAKDTNLMDLGCDVGAPIFYLAEKYPNAHYTGISISSVQIQIATELKNKTESNCSCTFIEADFHKLPTLPKQDIIFLVEAFVHSNNPKKLFEEISTNLKPGGKLIICDDFRANRKHKFSKTKEVQVLKNYISGWHAGSLLSANKVEELALASGMKLTENRNLTQYLNLWTIRDRFAHISLFFYKLLPFKSIYMESIKGGDALQLALMKGLINYRFLVFTKQTE